MKTALILEDHPEARRVLRETVALAIPGITTHVAPTIAEARALISGHTFDFALLDISLPDGNGIEFLNELKSRHPQAIAVMATIYADDRHLFTALRAGAQGYLLKEQPQADMVKAIKGMLNGHPPLSPSIAQRILLQFHKPDPKTDINFTPREIDVLTLLSKGVHRKEIAELLDISTHTVSDYVKNIYAKLDVHSSAEAVFEASRIGLL